MNMDIEGKSQNQLEDVCGCIDQVNLSINSFTPMLEQMMHIWQNSNECKNEIYYTHGDHLGSANWITDADGKPVQYIHYAPYGEQIANQQTIGYDERFKFTGKERDAETGYDYFGARFYWSADGIFTTVDPLADKYPGNTPYLYCNGNPIMVVDPDGREVINKMNPLTDKTLYDAGNNIVDLYANRIFFVSHGTSTEIRPYGEEPMSASSFVEYLSKNSEVWNNVEDKSSIVIVLISCETGKGENSIAQQISNLIPEATIIAPTEEIKAAEEYERAWIIGVAKNEASTLDEMKKPENFGQWRVFRNGEQVATSLNGKIDFIYKSEY